ncbi:DUF4867 family protein [Enterococcus gilvus]|uniref:DUF4867 domain-containing protein n=1 Tax=Enterococcus gilvus ATCC BAA-350 TaxID=1158614 RepID=R2VCL5_9ENTE|nr:DUF4867 family protein [Enterococcus gilvus]EOI55425.1 hypothetical protein UKC_02633 [Enterococcus gilvus ATCC BAA-350]EOW82032.1 hypothetical protein I592_01333 [Enterococcus gilvus ATCC BAA-350]OJG43061.1 hypothetical protein RV02_GL002981 [Enterococcus gilvus]
MKLAEIQEVNSNFDLYSVEQDCFEEYGRILKNFDTRELLIKLQEKPLPSEGNVYVPSDHELESLTIKDELQREIYGNLPIQIGYCNGNSNKLNALEYHKCPEINIATEDIVLFLGKMSLIKDDSYSSKNVVAFFVPKGTLIELYGTTLHFAPCKTTEIGFRTIVVLPEGTNEDFEQQDLDRIKDKTLFKMNKWLLSHPENDRMIGMGAYPGLYGENFELKQPVGV